VPASPRNETCSHDQLETCKSLSTMFTFSVRGMNLFAVIGMKLVFMETLERSVLKDE
jgi:hypothetical protein